MSFASATFENCKLDYADLSGQFLERIDFSASSLFQTNLSQANLTGAVMREVSLAAADVRGADFTDADLPTPPSPKSTSWK
jgi:uncharacterized protein YjbI with pentapeptide repeats